MRTGRGSIGPLTRKRKPETCQGWVENLRNYVFVAVTRARFSTSRK